LTSHNLLDKLRAPNFSAIIVALVQYILWMRINAYRLQSQTSYLCTKPVASVFSMMHILCFDIPADNIPSIPNASVETARRPHVLAAPLLEMREFLPESISFLDISGRNYSYIQKRKSI
jgi:hypothetical protein